MRSLKELSAGLDKWRHDFDEMHDRHMDGLMQSALALFEAVINKEKKDAL